MTRIKLYAEIDLEMDVEIPGLSADTQEYEKGQLKPQVIEQFQKKLATAFGEENIKKLVDFEYDVI
jgi:hypothetical protein